MARFEPIARRIGNSGWFLHEHFDALEDWPAEFQLPSPHFVLFLALDARGVGVDALWAFAERMLDEGLGYLVSWGPDCERVHDNFDDCIVIREVVRGITSAGLVMTTWHSRESLADAYEFFALNAELNDPGWNCTTWLAVTIGERAWADEVRRLLPQFAQPE